MKYILIIIMLGGGSPVTPAVTMQEFDTELACLEAISTINKMTDRFPELEFRRVRVEMQCVAKLGSRRQW
jgi:hypothetical protein